VEDLKAGVAIYAPSNIDARSLPFGQRSDKVKSALRNWLDMTVVVLALIIFVSFLLPVLFNILNVSSFMVGTDSLWLLHWKNSVKGFGISFNLWP